MIATSCTTQCMTRTGAPHFILRIGCGARARHISHQILVGYDPCRLSPTLSTTQCIFAHRVFHHMCTSAYVRGSKSHVVPTCGPPADIPARVPPRRRPRHVLPVDAPRPEPAAHRAAHQHGGMLKLETRSMNSSTNRSTTVPAPVSAIVTATIPPS